ncbi:hypothetical protein NBRC10512_005789 [Rhodotorula toruloides]|uniref:Zinc finger, MYND-type domain containing protein n=1 Tax=Rhodotorula toruloides (strain NP11) TaxID=1130832 RepID=M7X521_RHOT1|nr:zinc finger, MYND-type domain containing protein [Rhodotorula toruloides NP11]EMS18739.1 zinc finger, MYND-type domain containing protein [Rhodotorula toruloides NP11]
MVEGDCLVCGTSTTKRCKPCLEQSGIDLFFCSPDCQTLVWPGHRSFCGKNAFPVRFPLLSKNEALDIIPNVEVPLLRFNLGNGEEKHSLLTFFQTFLHPQVTRQELASRIWAITETDDGRANEVVVMAKANQALLYKARFSASPCANDKPLKELVITLVTQLCCDLNETFASIFYQATNKSLAERQALAQKYAAPGKACEAALHTFARKTFGQDSDDKLSRALVAAASRFTLRYP